MKVRFDGLDVQAMVALLQRTILGRRVVNIYDGDTNDCYIFKLEGSGSNVNDNNTNNNTTTASTSKEFLVMESGVRFHLTSDYQSTSTIGTGGAGHTMPSPFVSKLRKHIRTLRCEKIIQMNTDRVVLFQFGVGINKHSIILELYSKGNLILVDHNYIILALLRSHVYNSNNNTNNSSTLTSTTTAKIGDTKNNNGNSNKTDDSKGIAVTTAAAPGAIVQVGQVYPVSYATNIEKKQSNDIDVNNDNDNKPSILDMTNAKQLYEWILSMIIIPSETQKEVVGEEIKENTNNNNNNNEKAATNNNNNNKSNKKKNTANNNNNTNKKKIQQQQQQKLKNLLLKSDSGVSHYGPTLIEHCILYANLKSNISISTLFNDDTNPVVVDDNSNNNSTLSSSSSSTWWCQHLLIALQIEGKRVIDQLQEASKKDTSGYILYKIQQQPKPQKQEPVKKDLVAGVTIDDDIVAAENGEDNDNVNNTVKILEEFQPHLLKQHELRLYDIYDTFSEAVDTFYSNMAQQKALVRAHNTEITISNKLQKIQDDQYERIRLLEVEQINLYNYAKIIQYNADNVDKALFVINNALESGMDWDQIHDIVSYEKDENYNPIAMLIQDIDFHNNTMILRLPTIITSSIDDNDDDDNDQVEKVDDENDESKNETTTDVVISLNETAHGNANLLFNKYRQAKEKTQKTIDNSTKAFKAAEDNAKRQLLDAQKRKKIIPTTSLNKRIYYWFEKFHWFITSDNYLVIGGRDAQQNELLVKRYLRVGDAYLHADVFGASSCILRAKKIRKKIINKNKITNDDGNTTSNGTITATKTEIVPLSDIALREAGNFTICHSSAWTSKMITSAYWVQSHQVSKTAPTGEYLTTGAFMIRGKKNYLPPFSPLEIGFAILFKYNISSDDDNPDSVLRHKNERRDFALLTNDDDDEEEEIHMIKGTEDKNNALRNIDNDVTDSNTSSMGKKQMNESVKTTSNQCNNTEIHNKKSSGNDDVITDDVVTDGGNELELDNNRHQLHSSDSMDDTNKNNIMNDATEESEQNANDSKSNKDSDKDERDEDDDNNDDDDDDDDEDDDEANVSETIEMSTTTIIRAVSDVADNDTIVAPGQTSLEAPKREKRGFSAKDRKLIKKYGSLEEANRIIEARSSQNVTNNNDVIDNADNDTIDVASKVSSVQGQSTLKRGKKAKEKRAMKKYADQDDEDRELALLALQGGEKMKKGGKTKKGSAINKKGPNAAIKQQQEEVAAETTALLVKDAKIVADTKLTIEVREILAECITIRDTQSDDIVIRWDKFDGDILEQLSQLEPPEAQIIASKRLLNLKKSTRIDNFSASLGGILRTIKKYGHISIEQEPNSTHDGPTKRKTKQAKQTESMQSKETARQEGITVESSDVGKNHDDDDEAVDDTIELSKLTGKPHPDDMLLFCVPVCGPYSALKQYKYSVKLTPGNMKRGKAAKQCIEMFTKIHGSGTVSKVTTKGVPLADHEKLQIDLIKKIPDNDLVQAMCSDIKISAAGASKVSKAMTSNSKSKKKSK